MQIDCNTMHIRDLRKSVQHTASHCNALQHTANPWQYYWYKDRVLHDIKYRLSAIWWVSGNSILAGNKKKNQKMGSKLKSAEWVSIPRISIPDPHDWSTTPEASWIWGLDPYAPLVFDLCHSLRTEPHVWSTENAASLYTDIKRDSAEAAGSTSADSQVEIV